MKSRATEVSGFWKEMSKVRQDELFCEGVFLEVQQSQQCNRGKFKQ